MKTSDKILYLTGVYRKTYNQAPTVIQMNYSSFLELCDELNKDENELVNIYGMLIQLNNEVDILIEY